VRRAGRPRTGAAAGAGAALGARPRARPAPPAAARRRRRRRDHAGRRGRDRAGAADRRALHRLTGGLRTAEPLRHQLAGGDDVPDAVPDGRADPGAAAGRSQHDRRAGGDRCAALPDAVALRRVVLDRRADRAARRRPGGHADRRPARAGGAGRHRRPRRAGGGPLARDPLRRVHGGGQLATAHARLRRAGPAVGLAEPEPVAEHPVRRHRRHDGQAAARGLRRPADALPAQPGQRRHLHRRGRLDGRRPVGQRRHRPRRVADQRRLHRAL
ncbi:MAG: hypothetical protein AVDCRST_MAG07-470, partial [uncultured Frankineae bacterium]